MIKWEYQLVTLAPATEPGNHAVAVDMLNRGGLQGWEAVGFDAREHGEHTVLLKRPLAEQRASGGRV